MHYIIAVKLVKYVQQEGIVIFHVDQVVLEFISEFISLPDALCDREFLGLDEAFKHDADGYVDVFVSD